LRTGVSIASRNSGFPEFRLGWDEAQRRYELGNDCAGLSVNAAQLPGMLLPTAQKFVWFPAVAELAEHLGKEKVD
jgi:hypothetical protein